MSAEQKARLKALLMKAEKSAEEIAELATLTQTASTAGYKFHAETGEEIAEDGMTSDEVKILVADSVSKALGDIGLDSAGVKAIKTQLEGIETVDAEAIKTAVKSVMGGDGLSAEAIQKAITDNLPKDTATVEGVKTLLTEFKTEIVEATRRKSKMVFEDTHTPIETRGGNLTVGQKQLLNICMLSAPQTALDASDGGHGVKRPTGMNDGITEDQLKRAQSNGQRSAKMVRDEVRYGQKVLTTGGSGTGLELVNTDLSSDLQTRLYLASTLAAQLVASEVQMPSNPFRFPLSTTRVTFYKGTEGTAADASTPGTSNITLDAEKLIGIAHYTYEADEDSIIAILPFLQQNMGDSAAAALEDAFINGDTTATHMDADTEAAGAAAHQTIFKGLRKYAIAGAIQSSFASGGISAANISALRKMMGKYGIKPSDLFILVGPSGYNDIISLEQTLTAEKAGPNAARILTGVAPSLYGMPIITSEVVRETLNASGVYDGNTITKGSLLIVHRPSWIVGVRRGFTVETDVDKSAQVNKVIASFRRAFMPMETPSTSLPMVALGYNYDA